MRSCCNSLVWRQLTSENPPTTPFTSKEYTDAGLPWFDYYDDSQIPLFGSDELSKLKSVGKLSQEKGGGLPENEPITPATVHQLKDERKPNQVREWVTTE